MSSPLEPPHSAITTPQPSDGSLVRAFQNGNADAATALFERYAERVRALAGSRCTTSYAVRFDADDIVQSVFRSFFKGIQHATYEIPPDGQLWGLLLVLALNKIRSQMDHHRAAKRSVHRTIRSDSVRGRPPADDTSADFLRVVLDDIMTGLPQSNREIVRLRMDGHEVKEIADLTGRSRRTVERVLQDFRARIARSE